MLFGLVGYGSLFLWLLFLPFLAEQLTAVKQQWLADTDILSDPRLSATTWMWNAADEWFIMQVHIQNARICTIIHTCSVFISKYNI